MLILPKESTYSARKTGGAGALHFLVEHFSFFGFDAQYWMVVVVATIAAFVLIVLGTRNRT
jgi:hypothetical protein